MALVPKRLKRTLRPGMTLRGQEIEIQWLGLLPFDESDKFFLQFPLSASLFEVIDAPQIVDDITGLAKVDLETRV